MDHHGTHYTVEDARIYSRPEEVTPILVSGFGDKSIEQATQIVTPEMIGGSTPCGPDVDELYVSQIGPFSEDFFKTFEAEVLPALRSA